jgi:hypothetical protein
MQGLAASPNAGSGTYDKGPCGAGEGLRQRAASSFLGKLLGSFLERLAHVPAQSKTGWRQATAARRHAQGHRRCRVPWQARGTCAGSIGGHKPSCDSRRATPEMGMSRPKTGTNKTARRAAWQAAWARWQAGWGRHTGLQHSSAAFISGMQQQYAAAAPLPACCGGGDVLGALAGEALAERGAQRSADAGGEGSGGASLRRLMSGC